MKIYNAVSQLLPKNLVLANEPMSCHTSFKIGGPAEVYTMPENAKQASDIWQLCQKEGFPLTVVGDGCNVLVSDDGIKGIVLATSRMNHITKGITPPTSSNQTNISDNCIIAGSGTKLSKLAEAACNAGLSGLEFASGIPGTVGGAVYMNAGAYGSEIKDVCTSVEALHTNGEIANHTQLGFAYRSSRFQNEDAIITSATFCLTKKNTEQIREKMTNLNARRRESQPIGSKSAGSTFKRPAVKDKYASKLIDEHGLKGYTIGGAQVSTKHAGFVINTGNATAKDVLALIAMIQEKIYAQTGIWLEPEVQMLGF